MKKTNGYNKNYKYYGLDESGNIWMSNDTSVLHEAGCDVYPDYHEALMAKVRGSHRKSAVNWLRVMAVLLLAISISLAVLWMVTL
jgi:hypothetical protein